MPRAKADQQRHKDDQLRIRFARLTDSTSAACKRFAQQHDKLSGAARIERHIDVLRMGQMALEMGMTKALVFIDNEAWEGLTPEQRVERLLDALRMDGKLPASYSLSSQVASPAVAQEAGIIQSTPVAQQAAPQPAQSVQPAHQQQEPNKAVTEPDIKPEPSKEGNQQDVKLTEDGATFITQRAPVIKKPLKGLGDGA